MPFDRTGAGRAGPSDGCGRGDWDEGHHGFERRVVGAAGPHRSLGRRRGWVRGCVP